MLQSLIEKINPAQLPGYLWWFTLLAISIPLCGAIIGGFFVIGSLKVAERMNDEKLRSSDEKMVLAEAETGEVTARLTDTERQLDEAKLAFTALQKQHAPRSISDEQKQEFSKFTADAPRGPVGVYTYVNSGDEAEQYAQQVKRMLTDAGFETGSMVGQIVPVGPIPRGIFISLQHPDKPPPRALKIAEIIEVMGLGYKGTVVTSSLSEEMIIIVGLQ